jgi:hypothetical protein
MPHTNVLRFAAAACLAVGFLAATAVAADKADPNGTWKWTFTTPDGQEIPLSVTLKLDGEKLTGKVTHDQESTDISDGTFANDEVAFNVVGEQGGNKFTAKFKGKVEADSITGKIDLQIGDNNLSFDWNASRDKS